MVRFSASCHGASRQGWRRSTEGSTARDGNREAHQGAPRTGRHEKEHGLVTYSEVCDFWSGKPVDRGTERGRRERMIPLWMKVVRSICFMLIAAAIGAFLGYNGAALANMLFG